MMSAARHIGINEMVSYLNGECSRWRTKRIDRHLSRCWSCRHLRTSLEEEIDGLVRLADRWRFEDSLTYAPQFESLSLRIRRFEADQAATAAGRPGAGRLGVFRFRYAALSGLLALALGATHFLPGPLQQAARREQRIVQSALVRQRFSLSFNDAQNGQGYNSTIEILADRENQRYRQLWRLDNGTLLYGYWQPSQDREVVYDSVEGGLRMRRTSRALGLPAKDIPSDVSLGRLERAVSEWLEQRDPGPVDLTKDCLLLAGLPPTKGSSQWFGLDGAWRIKWTAGGRPTLDTLELQFTGGSFSAWRQVVLVGRGPASLTLSVIDSRPLPTKSLGQAQFEPPVDLIMADGRQRGDSRGEL